MEGDSNGDQQFAQDGAEVYGGGDEFTTDQTTVPGEGGNNPGSAINASKNDDDERKIFVGGLSWETTVKDLREYFEKYGPVVDCTLKTDPTTGRSRGFGFVMFQESFAVDKVLAEKGHHLHGRNIDPKRAKARGGKEPIKKVFVGGLDPAVPESDIRDHFSQFGKIEEIDLPYDKIKNQRRAFCFITFDSEETVDRVCAEQKQKLDGKEVDVKKATPKDQQGFGFGRGGRGGFGGPGGRGGGRGRGGNNYNQGGWGNQGGYDYNNYYNQGGYGGNGYDYNNYGGYDYNNYYNQGWGGYNQGGYGTGYGNQGYGNQGYGGEGGYDYSGWNYGNNQNGGQQGAYGSGGGGGGKAKRGGGAASASSGGSGGGGGGGYHPYSR